jgi:hypothetical protein
LKSLVAYDRRVYLCPASPEFWMSDSPRMLRLFVSLGVIASLSLAHAARASAQDPAAKPAQPAEDALQSAVRPLVLASDDAMKAGTEGVSAWTVDPAGKVSPATAAGKMTLRTDFLKADNNQAYVPFVLSIDASLLPSTAAVLYLRVAPKGTTAPLVPAAGKETDKDAAKKPAEKPAEKSPYPFEDAFFVDAKPAGTGQPLTVTRAFGVPAGSYDVYLAIRPRATDAAKPVTVTLLKQAVDVPNLWDSQLTTSSLIVSKKIDQLATPLTPEQQRDRPYAIGGQAEVLPLSDPTFGKADEIIVFFMVYNVALGEDKKPDVTIHYQPYTKAADGTEKPYKKVEPQQLNASTLPPNFDAAAGHQLIGNFAVPASALDPGDYRLEIKVTDNKSGKSVTREAAFKVAAS